MNVYCSLMTIPHMSIGNFPMDGDGTVEENVKWWCCALQAKLKGV